MIPAMCSLFLIIWFTLVPFGNVSHPYFTRIDGWGIVIVAFAAEVLALISFTMYINRTIKNRKLHLQNNK